MDYIYENIFDLVSIQLVHHAHLIVVNKSEVHNILIRDEQNLNLKCTQFKSEFNKIKINRTQSEVNKIVS